MSLIGDLFPARKRSTAMGVFWASTAFGTATSLMLGGVIAAHYGWRAAFLVAGAPGLVLAILLFLTVKEPARERIAGATQAEKAPTLLQVLAYVSKKPVVFHAFAGIGLNSLAMSGVPVWAASFLVRTQGFTLPQAGLFAGLGVGIFGAMGSLCGGPISDWVVKRGGMRSLPVVPFLASVVATIFGVIFAMGSNLIIVALGFIVFEVASRAFTAPAYNLLVSGVEPRMRGVTVSAVQAVTNLVGYGCGPFIVGTVSDLVGGPNSLKLGVASVMFFCFWAALHFLASLAAARKPGAFAST
jgi:predicted MFS family arabinose efflux permease